MAISSLNTNPAIMLIRLETAAMEGWGKMMQSLLRPMMRFPTVKQTERRLHDEQPQGIDLIGQYGKRTHDVDAERDV